MATVASTSGASVMAPSNTVHSRGRATSLNSPIASEGSEDVPMTKIQWMAMMLKAKVSGPQPTEAKKPIKINQNSFEPAPKVADLATKLTAKKKSKMPEGYGCVGSNREAIQRMIAMREDPAFSPRNQPIPQSTHVNIPGRPSARKLSSSTATESPPPPPHRLHIRTLAKNRQLCHHRRHRRLKCLTTTSRSIHKTTNRNKRTKTLAALFQGSNNRS
ncbi:hypothetical protein BGW42_002466 [Actinomortierella wolfii]|nr:hypothetical protein BGW42_002466 [Actinomortierella wolfii]